MVSKWNIRWHKGKKMMKNTKMRVENNMKRREKKRRQPEGEGERQRGIDGFVRYKSFQRHSENGSGLKPLSSFIHIALRLWR